MPVAPPPPARRSTAFLMLYALASAGGVIAYLPLLSLLLPMRIEHVSGDARLGVFTATVIIGAIVASGSNILFGWLSDRSVARGRTRRGWVIFGIALLFPAYVAAAVATTAAAILASLILVQLAINALLAPLAAIMADEIPDAQKGVASGMLALGSPLASAFGAALVGFAVLDETARFLAVPIAIAVCVTPLLFTRSIFLPDAPASQPQRRLARRDLAIAWVARLLVQVAGTVLLLYLYYYFESLASGRMPIDTASGVSRLMTLVYILSLPLAVGLGRMSDRTRRRKPILFGAAMLASCGLVAMAAATEWRMGAIGYGLYALGSNVFLVLHAGFAMLLLPSARHRGRDLGLLNLANTAPSLIGPAIAWMLATPNDFTPAMLALAILTLLGGFAILGVRSEERALPQYAPSPTTTP